MCSRNMRKMPRNQRQEGSKNNTTHTHSRTHTTHTPQKAAQSKRQHQASTSTAPPPPLVTPSEKNLKFSLWTCDGATTRVNGLGSSNSAPHIALATYRNACKLRNRHVASGAEFMNLPPTAGMSPHSHSLFFGPKMFVLVRFLGNVRCWTVDFSVHLFYLLLRNCLR